MLNARLAERDLRNAQPQRNRRHLRHRRRTRCRADGAADRLTRLASHRREGRRVHRDIVASFVQEKRSPLLQRPIVTRGVRTTPAATFMLWASTSPDVDAHARRPDPPPASITRSSARSKSSRFSRSSGRWHRRLCRGSRRFEARFAIRGRQMANASRSASARRLRDRHDSASSRSGRRRDQAVRRSRSRFARRRRAGSSASFEMTDPDGETTRVMFGDVKTDTRLRGLGTRVGRAGRTRSISRPLEAK